MLLVAEARYEKLFIGDGLERKRFRVLSELGQGTSEIRTRVAPPPHGMGDATSL